MQVQTKGKINSPCHCKRFTEKKQKHIDNVDLTHLGFDNPLEDLCLVV